MGGYNFQLDDEDENQLSLDGPLVEDLADDTNVAALPDLPKQAPVTAPTSQPVTAPASDYSERMKRLLDKAEQKTSLAGTEKENFAPVVTSTAPDWYKGGPPPKGNNDWVKALVGMGAGMIAGPAQAAMQDPNRPLYMKMQDAKRAGLAQGLGGLASSFLDRDKNKFAEETAAAKQQAAMNHVSSPGKSRSMNEADNYLELARVLNQTRGLDSTEQNRAFQQSTEAAKHNPLTPEVQATKQALVAKGFITPEQADQLTEIGIKQLGPLLNTQEKEQGAAARQAAHDTNARGNIAESANARSALQAEKQHNEDVARKNQAFIDDDLVYAHGVPALPVVEKLRDTYSIRKTSLENVRKMQEIQKELQAMSHGFSGTIDEWLGRFQGTPEGKRAQELVIDAQRIRQDLMNAERGPNRGNMGVPQEWEQRLVASLIPQAGSIQGWLKGDHAWESLYNVLDRQSYNKIKGMGAGLKTMGDEEGATQPYQETKRAVPSIAKVKGKQVVTEEPMPDVPTTDERLPVTATPPAPKASTGPKQYKVTPLAGGASFVRQLTPDQVQKALASKKFKVEEQ